MRFTFARVILEDHDRLAAARIEGGRRAAHFFVGKVNRSIQSGFAPGEGGRAEAAKGGHLGIGRGLNLAHERVVLKNLAVSRSAGEDRAIGREKESGDEGAPKFGAADDRLARGRVDELVVHQQRRGPVAVGIGAQTVGDADHLIFLPARPTEERNAISDAEERNDLVIALGGGDEIRFDCRPGLGGGKRVGEDECNAKRAAFF